MKFTVIGIYEDNDQVYMSEHETDTPEEAAKKAIMASTPSGNLQIADVLQVVDGEIKGQLGNDNLMEMSEFGVHSCGSCDDGTLFEGEQEFCPDCILETSDSSEEKE